MSFFLKLLYSLSLFTATVLPTVASSTGSSDKIYGVNIGSWLLIEPWMLPEEWLAMGGEICDDCSGCIRTEFALVEAYPDTADKVFEQHWNTWFTQDDVDKLVELKINAVRIPLGYWIVEQLVDRKTEFYPKGGFKHLKRGLRQLKDAGIKVMLDHHALPGVQTPNQMFAGVCTTDVQFYTDYNYHRALVWSAVMAAMSHLDPDFGSVYSIEAVNEPIMNATQTPGYGDFQKNFVSVVRAVETGLGIVSDYFSGNLPVHTTSGPLNVTSAILDVDGVITNVAVGKAIIDAAPIIAQMLWEYDIDVIVPGSDLASKNPLNTTFMDIGWQYNNPPNPADAANGPQDYDNHLYYNFGGVADANADAYLQSMCNLERISSDAAQGNSPLVFGEWSIATNFDHSDDFYKKWGDAQKRSYSMGGGWMFWNFKIENSETAGSLSNTWSYFDAVERGFLTKDPSELFDPHVCDAYIGTSTTSTTASSTAASSTETSSTATSSAEASSITTSSTVISSAAITSTEVSSTVTSSTATSFTVFI
ncbi:glycoside hydrolase family 5 [Pyrrhoderma noxium]|uniref:Glycoside hydrolase family 5 n=1 Tax=Pyrrhoderma noxium TaxID=2282107 RepID=A0A286UJV1_9AGAM|nr:glycoside hydrolase family 5 [Pyrrhoderma noxium]